MSHYLTLVLIKDEAAQSEESLLQTARVAEHLDRLLAPEEAVAQPGVILP